MTPRSARGRSKNGVAPVAGPNPDSRPVFSLPWPDSEEFERSFSGAADQRTVSDHKNRALHQDRVFERQVDDRVGGLVVLSVESQFPEVLVLTDELRWRIGELTHDLLERRPIEGFLQIFDDIELDVALAQNLQRAARLASARVVVQQATRHGQTSAEQNSLFSAARRRKDVLRS